MTTMTKRRMANESNVILTRRQSSKITNKKKNRNHHRHHTTTTANITNKNNLNGNINDALKNADVFIGVSKPNIINAEIIKSMNKDPIIFAMANPIPEIMPELALQAGAAIVATGRSDFPNQINNALVFPGIFRGALDNNVRKITTEHKLKTAEVIASLVANPTRDKIIPPIDHSNLVSIISKVIV